MLPDQTKIPTLNQKGVSPAHSASDIAAHTAVNQCILVFLCQSTPGSTVLNTGTANLKGAPATALLQRQGEGRRQEPAITRKNTNEAITSFQMLLEVIILPIFFQSSVCACAQRTTLPAFHAAAAPVLFAHAVVTEINIGRIITPNATNLQLNKPVNVA